MNNEEEKVIVDKEVEGFDSYVRRPYYRMRGKSVTPEQAFEIICRTDSFFWDIERIACCPQRYIGSCNFNNWLIECNHYPFGYGWIHTDGTVGGNAITQKYPTAEEFIGEWSENLKAFPYLDLVIAVTEWNEIPDDVWDADDDQRRDFEAAEYDEEFLDAIMVGIYVHNNTVEIMSPERTREKYKEYAALYEDPNRDKYRSDYYDKHGIVQVDEAYLRRCLESYELDPDETLKEIPEYIWRGFKSERRP